MVAASLHGPLPGAIVVGARPEHLSLQRLEGSAEAADLVGQVFFREPRGDVDVVLIRLDRPLAAAVGPLGRDIVTVETPAGEAWPEGVRVVVRLSEARVHLFDAGTGRNLLAAEGHP
jgi:hypothetical protein